MRVIKLPRSNMTRKDGYEKYAPTVAIHFCALLPFTNIPQQYCELPLFVASYKYIHEMLMTYTRFIIMSSIEEGEYIGAHKTQTNNPFITQPSAFIQSSPFSKIFIQCNCIIYHVHLALPPWLYK